MKKLLCSSVATLGLMTGGALAAEKVTVVTSFPDDMTTVIEKAFEAANPEYDLEVLNKSTSSGVKYVGETAGNNTTDLFWASAPDAFEVLKKNGHLAKPTLNVSGIPDMIGSYPMNDPDGHYFGFAASGYGIMWNTRYLEANGLEPAREWADLEKPEYFGHVGMSAPSRSGTTHLTVETVLQGEGWEQGWADWKWIAGNFATVSERSFGVPDGVNTGNFGLGIVIDFFGFSSKASGFPVDFAYPSVTALVPANIGVVANAPNEAGAVKFIEFLLSPDGQKTLLDPAIMRLPVNPETYASAPEGLPNPFEDDSIGAAVKFDVDTSGARYYIVSSMFDVMITYRLDDLRAAVKAVHEAEAKHPDGSNAEAAALIAEARSLIEALPITEEQSLDPEFSAAFSSKRKKADDEVDARQAAIEQEWDSMVVENYRRAKELAEKAAAM
ncbi:ABC transporter substrate-binding protein [Paracoccus fistulariae]|uniref:Extracellular solute-binding protein n=1 Tax=Paracoccus fistulariae TaxID=658446 RepID=A0ABY7SIT5_9RHOB|nr:extracellular solute-binding protein [Paracoccus fistulariae]MDB6180871.1 extracellular solute-binding protein [Paracoccus fistulariae]WCR06913.1 extracellular solute-binding protein [Paracoccus fistulariae]